MNEEVISDEEMASRVRKLLIDAVKLWASKEAQLDYQKNVPIADVSAELFAQWDSVYNPDNLEWMGFDKTEIEALISFNNVLIRETTRVTPYHIPDIEHFVYTLEWREINKEAIELLKKLKN